MEENNQNTNINEQQSTDSTQSINAQPVDNFQNMNAQQPTNNYQDMNAQQPTNNYQDMNVQQSTNNYQNQTTNNANPNAIQEKAPVLLRILCFFVPLVGLILYAVKYSSDKTYAKSCGIPALIGFILLLIPLLFVMYIMFVLLKCIIMELT